MHFKVYMDLRTSLFISMMLIDLPLISLANQEPSGEIKQEET